MIIYKYLDEEGAIKSIDGSCVLLKCPTQYNDPFDSLFYLDDSEIKEAYRLFINFQLFKACYNDLVIKNKKPVRLKLLANDAKNSVFEYANVVKETKKYDYLPDLSIVQYLATKFLRTKESDLKKKFKKEMNKICSNIRQIVLTSCFASSNDSILMWSHYGNKHRGACFEYEVNDRNFRKVNYSKDLKIFNLLEILKIMFGHEFVEEDIDAEKPEYEFLLEPILTKSQEWEYEAEVRYIYPKNKCNPLISDSLDDNGKPIKVLQMPKIKRIYLGCKATNKFVSEIREKAADIPVIKMQICKGEYRLKEK